jgi:hypothetical protein
MWYVFILFVIIIFYIINYRIKEKIGGKIHIEPTINISIKCTYYDKDVLPDCINLIHNIEFDISKLVSKYETSKCNTECTEYNLRTIINMELPYMPYNMGSKLLQYGEQIKTLSLTMNIRDISNKLKLSKVLILKQLLSELKYESHEIQSMLQDPNKLPDELKSQYFKYNLDEDIMSYTYSNYLANESKRFENYVIDFFSINNILTESDLRKERDINITTTKGELDLSTTNLTPDIIFRKPITVNGFNISWVEVKNYVMSNSKICNKYIKKQLMDYPKIFGKGLFVFRGGICADSKHPEVMFTSMNV